MADAQRAVSANVAGNFFVDSTCINCDACRQIAPTVFRESGSYSSVCHQPRTAGEIRNATRALLCCPTGSIGTRESNEASTVISDLPMNIEGGVYYCGFNSPKSFGGNSYFVVEKDGNWLIDSPKFLPHLVKRFKEMGGIKYIFLTHRDDVADANLYAKEFSASRIIHRLDLDVQPDSEIVVEGARALDFAEGFTIIPGSGHTRGHMTLLYKDHFLFTGDHLAYDRESQRLEAYQSFCWFSWQRQIEAMKELTKYSFEYVLPGHGQRVQMPRKQMKEEIFALVERMWQES